MTLETQLADARRLLNVAITEYERGSKEYALNGLKEVCARLLVATKEMQAEVDQDKFVADQLVYHDGVIVAVPVADNWEVRDTAVLIRPQGHCVDVFSPTGERWQV